MNEQHEQCRKLGREIIQKIGNLKELIKKNKVYQIPQTVSEINTSLKSFLINQGQKNRFSEFEIEMFDPNKNNQTWEKYTKCLQSRLQETVIKIQSWITNNNDPIEVSNKKRRHANRKDYSLLKQFPNPNGNNLRDEKDTFGNPKNSNETFHSEPWMTNGKKVALPFSIHGDEILENFSADNNKTTEDLESFVTGVLETNSVESIAQEQRNVSEPIVISDDKEDEKSKNMQDAIFTSFTIDSLFKNDSVVVPMEMEIDNSTIELNNLQRNSDEEIIQKIESLKDLLDNYKISEALNEIGKINESLNLFLKKQGQETYFLEYKIEAYDPQDKSGWGNYTEHLMPQLEKITNKIRSSSIISSLISNGNNIQNQENNQLKEVERINNNRENYKKYNLDLNQTEEEAKEAEELKKTEEQYELLSEIEFTDDRFHRITRSKTNNHSKKIDGENQLQPIQKQNNKVLSFKRSSPKNCNVHRNAPMIASCAILYETFFAGVFDSKRKLLSKNKIAEEAKKIGHFPGFTGGTIARVAKGETACCVFQKSFLKIFGGKKPLLEGIILTHNAQKALKEIKELPKCLIDLNVKEKNSNKKENSKKKKRKRIQYESETDDDFFDQYLQQEVQEDSEKEDFSMESYQVHEDSEDIEESEELLNKNSLEPRFISDSEPYKLREKEQKNYIKNTQNNRFRIFSSSSPQPNKEVVSKKPMEFQTNSINCNSVFYFEKNRKRKKEDEHLPSKKLKVNDKIENKYDILVSKIKSGIENLEKFKLPLENAQMKIKEINNALKFFLLSEEIQSNRYSTLKIPTVDPSENPPLDVYNSHFLSGLRTLLWKIKKDFGPQETEEPEILQETYPMTGRASRRGT